MQLTSERQIIRVMLWGSGQWRKRLHGTVIGSYEGTVGVLLDSGEYVDVPAEQLKVMN